MASTNGVAVVIVIDVRYPECFCMEIFIET